MLEEVTATPTAGVSSYRHGLGTHADQRRLRDDPRNTEGK